MKTLTQADDGAQEHDDKDEPSKKKKHAAASEEEGGAAAAAGNNGADDDVNGEDPSAQKKRPKNKNAPIERVDAAVDGIMSGSPFSELQLSERTQKVKKRG